MKAWYLQGTIYAGASLICTGLGDVIADHNYARGASVIITGIITLGLHGRLAKLESVLKDAQSLLTIAQNQKPPVK